jgi:hypothetical protein
MKTLKQYLDEQLWTAIREPGAKKPKRGKHPNTPHAEIAAARGMEITKDHKMGFWHSGKQIFMDRKEAAEHSGLGAKADGRLDSTHLQDRSQINRDVDDDPSRGSRSSHDGESVVARMRRLGFAEEKMNEANITNKEVADMANANDELLDKTYGYGRSKISPIRGKNKAFGQASNFNSALRGMVAAKRSKGNLRTTSDAIHRGWGETVKTHPAPDAKKQTNREKLKSTPYFKLSRDEQSKDDVIAKNIIKRVKRKKK